MATTRRTARLRLALALTLTGLAAAAGVTGAAAPASADVFDPLDLVHSEQVAGDVVTVGNAVLVCPGGPDDVRTDCLAASRRDNGLNNNRFEMRYVDVDADDSTYNSSTASVRLPAGARVTYARLSWAGNREGQQCGVGAPGTSPDDASSTDPVRLAVGGAPSRRVQPQDRTVDTTSVGYYSADAVVTRDFADLPVTDDPRGLEVTVGDVFSKEGRGCFGGWSLTLVHTADDAGCEAQRREVFVYDGHVRQGVGDEPISVRATGFRVAGGAVRAGVTAYEGDNGQVGDRLRVNSTPLEDPATGRDDNFFASTAQGRLAPDYANSFSVDAKRVEVPDGVIDRGDTEATIGVSTGARGDADAFLLQGLTLSVPVPALCLEKSASPRTARTGDTVTWTLDISNPSSVDATDVTVSDPAVPDCERTVGDLAAGASTSLTCTSVATEDLVNVASVTGAGPGGLALGAVDSAALAVVDPSVTLTKTAVEDTVVEGDRAPWRLRVENTGDTRLSDVTVADPLVPACARDLGDLAPGATEAWTCSAAVTDDLTNTATVTASAPGGPGLSESDSATVTVEPAPTGPAVEITKTAVRGVVTAGDRAQWDITVANTGTTPLDPVVVDDPLAPACDREWEGLAPGVERTYRCGRRVTQDLVNSATVTGTSEDGEEVEDADTAAVDVDGPFDVSVTAETGRTVPRQDVDLTVELTNDGSESVSGIVVTTDGAGDCARRRPITLVPGDSRSYTCRVRAGDDGDDLQARVTALGEAGGLPVTARDTARVRVLVPQVAIEVDVVARDEGGEARTDVTVSNPGETPLRAIRQGVTGATLCQLPDVPLAAGDTRTLSCSRATGDVAARVSAQPVLDGAALGPRVRATTTADATSPGWADDGTGDGGGSGGYDDGGASDDPGGVWPDGVLPDTGASRAMLPAALLGGVMLGAGLWLLRRTRTR